MVVLNHNSYILPLFPSEVTWNTRAMTTENGMITKSSSPSIQGTQSETLSSLTGYNISVLIQAQNTELDLDCLKLSTA